jgi:hypothetical protein
MANKLFQLARNAVQQAVGKFQDSSTQLSNNQSSQETHLSGQDMAVAQNLLSSAMANSSEAEKAQLAELQQELVGNSGTASQDQTSSDFSQQVSANTQELLEDNQLQ